MQTYVPLLPLPWRSGIVLKSHDPFCLIGEKNGVQWVTSPKFMPKSAGKLVLKFCRDSSLRLSFVDLYLEFKKALSNSDRCSYSQLIVYGLHCIMINCFRTFHVWKHDLFIVFLPGVGWCSAIICWRVWNSPTVGWQTGSLVVFSICSKLYKMKKNMVTVLR